MSSGLFRGRTESIIGGSRSRETGIESLRESSRKIEDRETVMLHLFTPTVKENPIIRPFTFRPELEFMTDLIDTIDDVRKDASRSISGIARDRFYMQGKRSADTALMSSDNSYQFGRNYLNGYWHFVLVANNAPLRGRHHESKLKNKVIYTGYIIDDEPVSKRGLLNPEATLVFTHMTQLDIAEAFGSDDYSVQVRPRLDLDILSPEIINLDAYDRDDRKYLISPNQVLDVLDDGEENDDINFDISSVTNPSLATLETKRNAVTEISRYNSPRQQFNRIVAGLAKTVLSNDNPDNDIISGRLHSRSRYDIRKTFRNYIGGDQVDRTVGPDYRKSISMSSLMSLYPSIERNIQIVDIPPSIEYNSLNEEGNDLLSLMSSYLKNTIPSVFADFGISDITIRYATSDPRQLFISKLDREPIFEVRDCQPVMDEPLKDTKDRTNLAIDYLQNYVFAVVENICDDIEVFINFQLGQDTIIQLQLRDHTDLINDEYVVHQGNLGGIISPQLGGVDEFENHNNALVAMLDIVDSGISQDRRYL